MFILIGTMVGAVWGLVIGLRYGRFDATGGVVRGVGVRLAGIALAVGMMALAGWWVAAILWWLMGGDVTTNYGSG